MASIHTLDSISSLQTGGAPSGSNVVYVISYDPTRPNGFGIGGGIFRLDSSDTTSSDDGGMVIVDTTTIPQNRWKRDWTGRIFASWYGAVGDGTAVDDPPIQAAIGFVASTSNAAFPQKTQPGGEVLLHAGIFRIKKTLTVNWMNVALVGVGAGLVEDTESDTRQTPATTLLCDSALGSHPMVTFESIGTPMGGGGLRDIFLDANGVATRCLEIKSWRYGTFKNLVAYGATDNIWVGCTSGVLSYPPYDSQYNLFQSIRSSDNNGVSTTNTALRLTGGQGNGGNAQGNTSFNIFIDCSFTNNQGTNVYSAQLENSDDNFFYHCEANFQFGCSEDDSAGKNAVARYNQIFGTNPGNILCKASKIGNGSSHDQLFIGLSNANGTNDPLLQQGMGGAPDATAYWISNNNVGGTSPRVHTNRQQLNAALSLGESQTAGSAADSAIKGTNSTLAIWNFASAHVLMGDGTYNWSLNIDGTNGNFRIYPTAGDGVLSTPKAAITRAAPAHSNSTGVKGEIATDSTYIYWCIGTNQWVRAAATSTSW